MKKTALIILDGWGHGNQGSENAILHSKTPFVDSLYKKYLNSELITHGEDVGLPPKQMGNSEVGHLNIGAGRVVYQNLANINNDIKKQRLELNPNLLDAIHKAKNKAIHIMGLLSVLYFLFFAFFHIKGNRNIMSFFWKKFFKEPKIFV